jgi:hypothetical protein
LNAKIHFLQNFVENLNLSKNFKKVKQNDQNRHIFKEPPSKRMFYSKLEKVGIFFVFEVAAKVRKQKLISFQIVSSGR